MHRCQGKRGWQHKFLARDLNVKLLYPALSIARIDLHLVLLCSVFYVQYFLQRVINIQSFYTELFYIPPSQRCSFQKSVKSFSASLNFFAKNLEKNCSAKFLSFFCRSCKNLFPVIFFFQFCSKSVSIISISPDARMSRKKS